MGLTEVRWLKELTRLMWLLHIQCDMVRTPMGIGFIGYVVKEAEGADWADGAARAIRTEETDVAEMVQTHECSILLTAGMGWIGRMGLIIPLRLLRLLARAHAVLIMILIYVQ